MCLPISSHVGHISKPAPFEPGTQTLPHNAVTGSPVTIALTTASVPPITMWANLSWLPSLFEVDGVIDGDSTGAVMVSELTSRSLLGL